MRHTQVKGLWTVCCSDESNWQLQPRERWQPGEVDVYRCKECQRKHSVMHCGDKGVMKRVTGSNPFPGKLIV